jgi:hypothetical protein
MGWAPQLKFVDELEGGGVALHIVETIFGDRVWARRTVEHYLEKKAVYLARDCDGPTSQLSVRECYELLWSDDSWGQAAPIFVHLTDYGADRWQAGEWDDVWKDKRG